MPRRFVLLPHPFQRFFATEAASGVVLIGAALAALVWANSPWASLYEHVWESRVMIGAGYFVLTLSLHQWVNDGLMAVFFFLVGLEIKREMLTGELARFRSAVLPLAAALGGMLVPALLYGALNAHGPGARGWAIPMATDIAFALGILALLGDRVPTGIRIFLAALAIADDLGAVLVIALFYTGALHWAALGGAAVVLGILYVVNRAGARRPYIYATLGVVLWLFVLSSGVHPTIAGVLLALMVPAHARIDDAQPLERHGAMRAQETTSTESIEGRSTLQQMEQALHGVVAFVIMPLFALANAGLTLDASVRSAWQSPVTMGVVLGLVIGKPAGILLASYCAVKCGAAELPAGIGWRHIHSAGWLGGIGFTMSLFIATLAFGEPALIVAAKAGILSASVLAGLVGYLLLRNTALRERA